MLVHGLGVRDDQACEAAGREHARVASELGAHAPHDAVDLAGEAVDDAALERMDRVRPITRRRGDELDAREPCCAVEERLHRDRDAGREHAADVLAARRDGVEVRRRAEVDDDARPAARASAATALTMRSGPTSRGLSYRIGMPVCARRVRIRSVATASARSPSPLPLPRQHRDRRRHQSASTTSVSRSRSASRPSSSTASSSVVRIRPRRDAPRVRELLAPHSPRCVCVLPTSTASSMRRRPLPTPAVSSSSAAPCARRGLGGERGSSPRRAAPRS